jgi:hypothetical protein
VAGWPKTSRRENKSGGTVELESRRDLAMATSRKGFPFYSSKETQRSSQPTEVGTSRAIRRWPHGARYWSAREISATWSWPWKRDGRVSLRRHTIMALKRMGSNGRKNWP